VTRLRLPFPISPSLSSPARGGGGSSWRASCGASELQPRWSRAGPQRAPASSGDDDRRPTGEAPGSDFSSYKFCCRKNFKSFYLNFFYIFFARKVLFQNFLFFFLLKFFKTFLKIFKKVLLSVNFAPKLLFSNFCSRFYLINFCFKSFT
jgi:hypothetical protein